MNKLIAHRGNIDGPNSIKENSPIFISKIMDLGYDVEIDLRLCDGEFKLGHDRPEYSVSLDFLVNFSEKLWIHCKNYEVLEYLSDFRKPFFNFFFHTDDEYTMTSKGYIFTRPGGKIGSMSVMVMPELVTCYSDADVGMCHAVCSDFVSHMKSGHLFFGGLK